MVFGTPTFKKNYICYVKVDKGTDTGTMATMHGFLRQHHGEMDPHETVLYAHQPLIRYIHTRAISCQRMSSHSISFTV